MLIRLPPSGKEDALLKKTHRIKVMDIKRYNEIFQGQSSPILDEEIELYVRGELPPKRAFEVEKWLNQSPEAASLAEGFRVALEQGVNLKEVESRFQQKIVQTATQKPSPSLFKVQQGWIRYAMQSAAVIATLVMIWLGYDFLSLSGHRLYADQYKEHAFSYSRAKSASPEEVSSAIEQAYRDQQYDLCIQTFEANWDTANGSAVNNFFAGNAYLAKQNPDKASECFEKVLEINRYSPTKYYQDEAEYYLALSYLDQEKLDEANLLIQQITQKQQHKRYMPASGIRGKMRLLLFKRKLGF